jgi:hypothetical protein
MPILLLPIMAVGAFVLSEVKIPFVAGWLILEALASVWVYYDSKALNLRYPQEWARAELASPFWIGVTTLIFAPLGLPFYTYHLNALNNALRQSV